MKDQNIKRYLALHNILYKETDDDNYLTTNDILNKLNALGFTATRKTLAKDIKLIIDSGTNIVITKNKTEHHYRYSNRIFSPRELKVLIDALESSRVLTTDKTDEISKKLLQFASSKQKNALKRSLYINPDLKPKFESVFDNLDIIHNAIDTKTIVTFQYMTYNENKQKVKKHNGFIYRLSPYYLTLNNNKYYVIGYCEKNKKIVSFRLDRMNSLNNSQEPARELDKDYDIDQEYKNVMDMYACEKATVSLKCHDSMMDQLIDQFGEDFTVIKDPIESNCFIAKIYTSISPVFFGWIFQNAGKISITSPKNIRDEFIAKVTNCLDFI